MHQGKYEDGEEDAKQVVLMKDFLRRLLSLFFQVDKGIFHNPLFYKQEVLPFP